MKFIRTVNGDLLNMEVMHRIGITIIQEESKKFAVCAWDGSQHRHVIKFYNNESVAQGFVRRLYEHYKIEVTE